MRKQKYQGSGSVRISVTLMMTLCFESHLCRIWHSLTEADLLPNHVVCHPIQFGRYLLPVCRVALYVSLIDSSLSIISAEDGSFLGKDEWIKPKNTCTALAVALLDTTGSLLHPAETPLHLTWASNDAVPAQPEAGRPSLVLGSRQELRGTHVRTGGGRHA